MNWLKEVIVDLIVTLFIIIGVFLKTSWMWWVILGYTGIMVLAKIVVLAGDSSLQLIRKSQTSAPDWFSHLLYAVNSVSLLYANWWIAAGGWIFIWVFSYLARRKLKAAQGK